MDKILEKIEVIIEKQLSDLESKPIQTSFRLFIMYWIFKKVWEAVKK